MRTIRTSHIERLGTTDHFRRKSESGEYERFKRVTRIRRWWWITFWKGKHETIMMRVNPDGSEYRDAPFEMDYVWHSPLVIREENK